jgi:DNA-binding transcriptional regulator YhcF (GntR family)
MPAGVSHDRLQGAKKVSAPSPGRYSLCFPVGVFHARVRQRISAGAGKPVGRRVDLVVEDIGDEVLVYDQRSDQAHCLGSVAGRVWRACDGATTVEQLSTRLGLEEATTERALDELEQCGLLETGLPGGVTRREAAARIAKVGAAAASAPLIYSIAAPTPALAASQAFCVRLGCSGDCGLCHTAGCSCCVGNMSTHVCTANCSGTNCNTTVIHICNPSASQVSCN